jgi:lysyl-tRNA synthetase class 1
MHWADVLAEELIEEADEHVLATAITPSGPIHVGNLREVLTTEAVHRSLRERGAASQLLYIGDTYDPLRKVYPFLDEDAYEQHVGKPLSEIPCPCGDHRHYAEHFLVPFLEDLEALGVSPTVKMAHEMYQEGAFLDATITALDEADAIAEILERVSDRDLPDTWLPYNVQCQECRRLDTTYPVLYEYPVVEYACTSCGHEGETSVTEPGGAKLPWRVDWPARWDFLGVTFESFGKDHAAAGGSWDTGKEIVRDVYGRDPPHHTVYEFIQLKGEGAMHSSTGTAVSGREVLRMTPPEVVRFLVMRYEPERHIDFDPGFGLLDLVEDYDRWEDAYYTGGKEPDMKDVDRTVELSQPYDLPSDQPPRVNYKHLVTLVQLADTFDEVVQILKRGDVLPGDAAPAGLDRLRSRVDRARYWADQWAPEPAKLELAEETPTDALAELSEDQRAFADAYLDELEEVDWEPEALHGAVYEAAETVGVGGGEAFPVLYRALLAEDRGPRAGYFLSSLDPEFVRKRVEAAAETGG